MKRLIDLGWSVARIDTTTDSLVLMTPYDEHMPAQSITVYGVEHLVSLRDLLLEAFPLQALEAQLGAGAKVAATRKEAVAPTCVANDCPVSVPSVPVDWWRFHAINCDDRGNKLAADACRLAAAVTRWYGQPNVDGSSLVGIVEKFVRGEKLPEVKP